MSTNFFNELFEGGMPQYSKNIRFGCLSAPRSWSRNL